MASNETFKSGLFGIGLNIEKKASNDDLLVLSKQLSYHSEYKPKIVKQAIYNLQAVVLFHMDLGRTEARLRLEKLNKEYPQDLNILADLIHVYKQMGREKDSYNYKKKLEELQGNELFQARSILSQAYAMHEDLTAEYHETPEVLLQDICWQLNKENKYLEQVDKAIVMVMDAHEEVKTIPSRAYDETIYAKEIYIEKFERGIRMLQELDCSKEEILVGKHNLANARSKLENLRCKRGDYNKSRVENCIKALEGHLDVIENLSTIEEPLKICVARSYILFAQLYMSRKTYLDKIRIPQRIKTRSRDLDSMRRKALSMCPYDQTVLQRSGRYEVDRKNYSKGIKIYRSSIDRVPDEGINWFSYTSRSDAYYYRYIHKSKTDEDLERAYNDGERCLQSKCTVECMIKMARLSFLMAKPDETDVGFHCEEIEFIYEAIETLHETFNKRGNTEYAKIHRDLGKYYPYIGEYRKAIGSLKTNLELIKWSWKCPDGFSLLSKCFVAFYKKSNDKNLLFEFRYMLEEAKKKDRGKWIKEANDLMHKHNPKMLTDLTEICGESEFNGPREIQYGPSEIQESQWTKKFKYDLYVSHSEKDKDWVNCMLLPQIEEFDDEIKFKGCIPNRDCRSDPFKKIDSIINGIKQSCKLLIILTPNYLKDNWETYVRDLLLFSVHEKKVRDKTIIPIILEECEIPSIINLFNPISFTENSKWERLRSCLTVNMDPETRVRKKMAALNASDIDEDLLQGQFYSD